MSHSCDSHGASRSFDFWHQNSHPYLYGRVLETVPPSIHLDKGVSSLRDGGAHWAHSPLTPHYWCRVASLLSQTSRDHNCGRVTWQVLMRGKPLTTVVDELPSWHSKGGGFSSAALGHRPQNRAKGADPRTGNLKGEKWFCPGVLSSPLSWPACAGAFLVPGRWFSGPAPSGSSLFWFCFMFLSIGRGRHVPAPSGRDVGSAQGHRPKNRPFPGIPFTCVVLVFVLSLPLCVVYFILLLAALAFSSL